MTRTTALCGARLWNFGLLAGLGLVAWPSLGFAQAPVARVRTLVPADTETPLPDVDAIENGAPAPASVSFKRAPGAPSPEAEADAVDGFRSSGGIYGLDHAITQGGGRVTNSDGQDNRAEVVPELHTVKKGDTLWGLSDYYYGDPFGWPKLWSRNPLVTNPHWIFPGDVVRLREGGESDAPPVASSSNGQPRSATAVASGGRNTGIRQMGFIEASEIERVGTLTGSREEKIMLSTGDQAYVGFPKNQPLKAGERYAIFKADKQSPVKAPDGKILGYLIYVLGDLKVDQVADETSGRGTLLALTEPVERGYAVSSKIRQYGNVLPRPSAVSLEATIVASFGSMKYMAAENTFVVLSRGSKDGIEVGNRTFVIRRGDGYRPVMENWQPFDLRYPKEVVGELLVVDVRENASVAMISKTLKEIRVGETTEMRKGY